MKLILSTLWVFILAGFCFSQRTFEDLKPSHAAALRRFLSANKQYRFLSTQVISAEYMKFMRESMGKSFEPYYRTGDFNGDRVDDFAVILARAGKPKASGATSEEHKYDYPLAIVIFNGNKNGGFVKVFAKEIEAPYVCFLDVGGTRKKSLHFGVFETDFGMRIFALAQGKGYIVESTDEFR